MMKRIRVLRSILIRTGTDKIILIFVLFFFLNAFFIYMVEPDINSYRSALWYCYEVFSTVGFGDKVCVTPLGRILTGLVTLVSLLVVAIVTGVVVAYYNDMVSIKYKLTKAEILDKLEHLPELSKEELEMLSKDIRDIF